MADPISVKNWDSCLSIIILLHLSEPGYYEDNSFGIRIEDIMYTVEADTEVKRKDFFSAAVLCLFHFIFVAYSHGHRR